MEITFWTVAIIYGLTENYVIPLIFYLGFPYIFYKILVNRISRSILIFSTIGMICIFFFVYDTWVKDLVPNILGKIKVFAELQKCC